MTIIGKSYSIFTDGFNNWIKSQSKKACPMTFKWKWEKEAMDGKNEGQQNNSL